MRSRVLSTTISDALCAADFRVWRGSVQGGVGGECVEVRECVEVGKEVCREGKGEVKRTRRSNQ